MTAANTAPKMPTQTCSRSRARTRVDRGHDLGTNARSASARRRHIPRSPGRCSNTDDLTQHGGPRGERGHDLRRKDEAASWRAAPRPAATRRSCRRARPTRRPPAEQVRLCGRADLAGAAPRSATTSVRSRTSADAETVRTSMTRERQRVSARRFESRNRPMASTTARRARAACTARSARRSARRDPAEDEPPSIQI